MFIEDAQKVIEEPDIHHEFSKEYPPGTSEFWFCIAMSIALTLLAGLMSGLTVGYLSIDELVLELKLQNGTEEEKQSVHKPD